MHQTLDWVLYSQYVTYSFPKAWGRYDDFHSTRWGNLVLRDWITCLESHSHWVGPEPTAHSEVRSALTSTWLWPSKCPGHSGRGGSACFSTRLFHDHPVIMALDRLERILVLKCGSQCFSEMTGEEGILRPQFGFLPPWSLTLPLNALSSYHIKWW